MKMIRPISSLSNECFSHFLLFCTQVVFSGWHIIGHAVMHNGVNPFIFVFYRECTASFLMFLFVRYKGKDIAIDPVDYSRFFLLGCCSFCTIIFSCVSLHYISPTRYAIFQPSVPCITTMISIAIGAEKITFPKVLGILLAVLGSMVVIVNSTSGGAGTESNVTLGMFCVLVQVTTKACILVYQRQILLKYDPSVCTCVYTMVGAGLTLTLITFKSYQYTASQFFFNDSSLPWYGLAYSFTFVALFGHNCLSYSGLYLSPSTISVYCTFQPVATISLSFLLLGVLITVPEILGALLVVAGLVVTISSQSLDKMCCVADQRDSIEDKDVSVCRKDSKDFT
jgi:drug/metabolite transporter (DMT)-like permease